ncbi:hypothetical protein L9F63_024251 [Diploptera punctata]|uniref:Pyridoxal phosphate phosphatase PHOSPHO2 n=1 Tax=Diploptera punctata TaxID=6984 RepID=A0AAD8E894_DIPPU|nr:hypothetical protein L9F63_024251 [Diploptera punctata]
MFMQQIFELLHADGVAPAQIREAIVGIPATPGMDKLLRHLKQYDAEVIVVSDSNSVFIHDWLSSMKLEDTVTQVFTNPAQYDDTGFLRIQMYHVQDWCDLSSKNLCKGHILSSYIAERQSQGITFSQIAYVGDGKNDLCPSLRLTENDFIFAREGFMLVKRIREMQEGKDERLKAKVHIWKSGDDIWNVLANSLLEPHN